MFGWGIAGSPSLLQSMIGLASSVRCWQNGKPLGTLAKQKLPRKDLANLMQEVLQQTRSMTLPFPEFAKHRRLRSLMKSDEVWCSVMNTQMTKDWFTRLFWTFDMVASCLTGFVFSDGAFDTISIIIAFCCWEQRSGFFWVWKLRWSFGMLWALGLGLCSGSVSPNLQASSSTNSVPSCDDTRRLGALGSTLLESNGT